MVQETPKKLLIKIMLNLEKELSLGFNLVLEFIWVHNY